jgi:hypothetical protein
MIRNIATRRPLILLAPVLLALALLSGCATPIEKSEITPKLYASAEKTVALSVLEARPYVLTGGKTAKFEGIVRGGFGIPVTVDRPNRPAEERFVDLLAGMVKDGLTEAGVNVNVVAMPTGASLDDALKKMSETSARRYIVIRVVESTWDAGGLSGNLSYKYDFTIFVGRPGATQPQGKTFAASEANKASDKYNVFDMHSVRYKEIIESMFADPQIRQALQN